MSKSRYINKEEIIYNAKTLKIMSHNFLLI